MNYDVIDAKYVDGYKVHLRFRDGVEGDIDLSSRLWGPIFEPLRDIGFFKSFRIDPESHTLVWPNDADIAPETLHDEVRVRS